MDLTAVEQRLTRNDFLKNLAESALLSTEEMERIASIHPTADGFAVAHALVEMRLLTTYQMEFICQGRHKELRIGNYDVLEKLGAGGMGTVYKARHRRMKRVVALKVLAKNLLKDTEFVRRFQREVETIAQLNHANIVLAYDADESEMGHFLVMELVDGQDLATLVRRFGPMSMAEAVDCILQAARGLEYVHVKGMIHRDVKPANLLRGASGVVKVTDLGLARFSGPASGTSSITQAGGIVGTVDFMSPEQATDSSCLDPRADIYSLGATLYFLITGQPPYAGPTWMATLIKHRDAPIPSLQAARPEVHTELDDLCRLMLAKAPADRPQSMSDIVRLLSDIVNKGLVGKVEHVSLSPTISLPQGSIASAAMPAAQGSAPTVDLSLHSTAPDMAVLKILLVEPSRTQAAIIRSYLLERGIDQIAAVGTGKEALTTVRRDSVHAIICSLHLPDMTGAELAQQIRTEGLAVSLGFVLISTEADSAEAGSLSKCGQAVLLHKPFTSEQLFEALNTVLGAHLMKRAGSAVAPLEKHAGHGETISVGRQALRVLIVDDSAAARLHERKVLQGLGFAQFAEAADGAQAVAAVTKDNFDLIVADYNMPHMDGKGLVGYLRQNPATANIPIMMITTETDPDKLEAVRRLGVKVCDKNFSADAVQRILNAWFLPE